MNSSYNSQQSITLVFGSLERQREIDAVLRMFPDTRQIPMSGGRYGKPGTAVVGFGSIPPRTIWCICPTLRCDRPPEDALGAAIRQALQRAVSQDFLRVAILLETNSGINLGWPEMVQAAVDTAVRWADESGGLREIRLVASDSRVLAQAKEFIENDPHRIA